MKTIKPIWLIATLFTAVFLAGPMTAQASNVDWRTATFDGKSVKVWNYCTTPNRPSCARSVEVVQPVKGGNKKPPSGGYKVLSRSIKFRSAAGERKIVRIPLPEKTRTLVRSYLSTPNALRLWVRVKSDSKRTGEYTYVTRFKVAQG